MHGNGIQKGIRQLKSIEAKLFESITSVHLIGSRNRSREIIGFHLELNEDNIEDLLYNKWNADGGATYLWEYVWEVIKALEYSEFEIIIITDGQDN